MPQLRENQDLHPIQKNALVEEFGDLIEGNLVPPVGLSADSWRCDSDLWKKRMAKERRSESDKAWRREHVYAFWKHILCENAPRAFEYTQAIEARSRFFGGMIRAADASVILVVPLSPSVSG